MGREGLEVRRRVYPRRAGAKRELGNPLLGQICNLARIVGLGADCKSAPTESPSALCSPLSAIPSKLHRRSYCGVQVPELRGVFGPFEAYCRDE